MDGIANTDSNEALVWPPEAVTAARQAQHEAEHREYFGSDDDYQAIEWTPPAPVMIQAECPSQLCNHDFPRNRKGQRRTDFEALPEYYLAFSRWRDVPPERPYRCPLCNQQPLIVTDSPRWLIAISCRNKHCELHGRLFSEHRWHDRAVARKYRHCFDRQLWDWSNKHREMFDTEIVLKTPEQRLSRAIDRRTAWRGEYLKILKLAGEPEHAIHASEAARLLDNIVYYLDRFKEVSYGNAPKDVRSMQATDARKEDAILRDVPSDHKEGDEDEWISPTSTKA